MRSASRSVSAPSQQTRTPPCWRFQFVPPAKFQERIRVAKSKQAQVVPPRSENSGWAPRLIFFAAEGPCTRKKSFFKRRANFPIWVIRGFTTGHLFEFQMKKDGEGAIGEENSESAATRAGATPCRAPVDVGLWSRRRQRKPRGRAIARVSWCARTFVRRVCERS